ncbi:hypothetical protein DDZ13_09795 [Coraliomargarita sinensis]|uniref:DUF1365 domain-containing protein n=1 Tax=Coraliomargarita sinensis TaxID=2174842 RepID=A0A317ZGA5_9BACT|nr:DUF1365 domain-containing protein [Coraliomargarita sinensis]PXA03922.1 hypothetical protein DDZ13_09795 [Coraliomargarita sinensis]
MIEHSKIYRGKVTHERIGPVDHTFTYPMTFFSFALDELKEIESSTSLFGYNQSRPLRISDSDFLRGSSLSISEQLNEFLPPEKNDERTFLISSPRYFGYAFNPVNFYLRMDGETLTCVVAEVNNTFGDRHIYPLNDLKPEGPSKWTASCAKDFHVSPFNDMSGEYHFTFRIENNELFLGVDLWKNGECAMKTWIEGRGLPLTVGQVIRHALFRPFDTAINSMPRILWQAAILYYRKKLQVYKRPSPSSIHTVKDRDKPDDCRDII